jgi:hypothetical protein
MNGTSSTDIRSVKFTEAELEKVDLSTFLNGSANLDPLN